MSAVHHGRVAIPVLSVALFLMPAVRAQDDVGATAARLSAPDPVARTKAACSLRAMGRQAAPALGALIQLLADASPVAPTVCDRHWGHTDGMVTSPGQQAASALVALGSVAVLPLITALESPAWPARRNAAWALGALDDTRAVPALTRVLSDPEPQVREQAVWALGALDAETAVPVLIAAVRDADPRVRAQAAWALGAIGDTRGLAAALVALNDADPLVRRQGAWAVGVLAR